MDYMVLILIRVWQSSSITGLDVPLVRFGRWRLPELVGLDLLQACLSAMETFLMHILLVL
ncbi:hypothetical protein KFK09_017038 [Dendrobium nobile]|uniref:Uncharacterized protein n=1 Tax=Dendrobium nobile TaxID=94219 RepID=A0A8T3B2B6_DENNO|nr:hypothetical protein KFK09_017038 [Dendrobium nobile]